jgi:hypothetical protein
MIRNIHQLEEQYRASQSSEEKPYVFWTFYKGTDRKNRIASNNEITDVDASWDFLRSTIERTVVPGRSYEVLLKNVAKHNTGYGLELSFSSNPGANGIHGAQSESAVPGIYDINSLQRYTDEKIEQAMLKREVEELRSALEAPANVWDRIGDKMLGFLDSPNGAPLVNAIAMKVLGMAPGGVSMAGFNHQQQQQQTEPMSEQNHESTEAMSDEEINDYLARIDEVIPLQEALPILWSLVEGKTTDQVRQQLKMLKAFA